MLLQKCAASAGEAFYPCRGEGSNVQILYQTPTTYLRVTLTPNEAPNGNLSGQAGHKTAPRLPKTTPIRLLRPLETAPKTGSDPSTGTGLAGEPHGGRGVGGGALGRLRNKHRQTTHLVSFFLPDGFARATPRSAPVPVHHHFAPCFMSTSRPPQPLSAPSLHSKGARACPCRYGNPTGWDRPTDLADQSILMT